MKKIELDLLNAPNILSVFYGGSIGNQNTDLYSEIDLPLSSKMSFLKSIGQTRSNERKTGGTFYFMRMTR